MDLKTLWLLILCTSNVYMIGKGIGRRITTGVSLWNGLFGDIPFAMGAVSVMFFIIGLIIGTQI